MITYRLLDRFRALFEGVKYEHRKSTHGDKVAVCLYEDLLALRESTTLIRGIETRKLVVNAQNRTVGVRTRRGDGTFGPLVDGREPLEVKDFSVARGDIATVEIGVEVKIVSTSMHKQRDRVENDLTKQVGQFRTKANNPVCVGIVGINWADRYTSYEGSREYRTDGGKQPHPIQQAESTEAWLRERLDSKLDVLLVLQYRARNEPPHDFEWVDHIDVRLRYAAELARIAGWYETRFGAVHSSI